MKKFVTYILLFLTLNGFSQDIGFKQKSKINVATNFSAGSTFKNSYFLHKSLSPSLNYKVNNKLSTTVGFGVASTNYVGFPIINSEQGVTNQNINKISFFTYATGNYSVNDKLNVFSTILFEDANYNFTSNMAPIQKRYKDISFGFDYNVLPGLTINAEFNISDRPYRNYGGYLNQAPFKTNNYIGFP